MIGDIVRKVNNLYQKRLDNIISLSNMEYDEHFIWPYLKDAPDLLSKEKEAIKLKWGGVIPYLSRGYGFYKALKIIDKFSCEYLPSSYYFPIIENALNPKSSKFELSHKGLLELIFGNVVKVATTVLRTYNGIYWDDKYHPITPAKASDIIKQIDVPMIFKPAKFTVQGMGIMKLDNQTKIQLATEIESGLATEKYGEFVIQMFVGQSDDTKIFNPTSLNCMRITTLNLNNKITVCTRALKCGSQNSIIDNIGTGKNGVCVGINYDGSLCEFGYYGNGERTKQHNGVAFEGKSIKNFSKVLETAQELHRINPICKIIGWDLALDENDDVVLIESNAAHPGISVEQIATGPVFGGRTDEVIAYVKRFIKKRSIKIQ